MTSSPFNRLKPIATEGKPVNTINKQNKEIQNLTKTKTWSPWQQGMVHPRGNYSVMLPGKFQDKSPNIGEISLNAEK